MTNPPRVFIFWAKNYDFCLNGVWWIFKTYIREVWIFFLYILLFLFHVSFWNSFAHCKYFTCKYKCNSSPPYQKVSILTNLVHITTWYTSSTVFIFVTVWSLLMIVEEGKLQTTFDKFNEEKYTDKHMICLSC